MNDRKTIAILGASTGQKILYLKAREMGLYVIGFAWDTGVLSDDMFDEFHTVSVTDIESIVRICRQRDVDGVVTNASEFLMPLASEIADRLGLICTPSDVIRKIQNKKAVREMTRCIPELAHPQNYLYPDRSFYGYPCVVKPIKGASKKGVSFCMDDEDFSEALRYAGDGENEILVEEYISGREFSVESLSFNGVHSVIQITDKDSSGPPHFVELGHHQPSTLPETVKERVKAIISKILDCVGFRNGATHIEMKYDEQSDRLYLIEINCRGGGDHISDTLVSLSTDCDYISEMINVALGQYTQRTYSNTGFSGISYLSKQNNGILKYFSEPRPEWMVYSERTNSELSESTSNYDRDGFFIYKSSQPVEL
ncbi:MAG: ATP-grasp domain-containing protein [Lachnospiraceae bacterium]|nr:ATP-grasp domain-containing protein [Lachnospiraceae bacterium]